MQDGPQGGLGELAERLGAATGAGDADPLGGRVNGLSGTGDRILSSSGFWGI